MSPSALISLSALPSLTHHSLTNGQMWTSMPAQPSGPCLHLLGLYLRIHVLSHPLCTVVPIIFLMSWSSSGLWYFCPVAALKVTLGNPSSTCSKVNSCSLPLVFLYLLPFLTDQVKCVFTNSLRSSGVVSHAACLVKPSLAYQIPPSFPVMLELGAAPSKCYLFSSFLGNAYLSSLTDQSPRPQLALMFPVS